MAIIRSLLGDTAIGKFLGLNDPAPAPVINFYNSSGQRLGKEHRVIIKVPSLYMSGNISYPLSNFGGIIFPYTPQISLEHKADFSTVNAMHSNYSQNFYQKSSVGQITIQGKFTVQNNTDAETYLATVHLLRALTKMLTGGDGALAGAPPPVCRLSAYGTHMLENVPVTVTNFRTDLPNNVDYFTLYNNENSGFGEVMVPVSSDISVSLIPMYSRNEQQNFSVNGWLSGDLNSQGYL